MLDFGPYCYLDVQKTGSSFVCAFLQKHAATAPVKFVKHGLVKSPAALGDDGKLFFTSVRDPLELYRSLHAFGQEGKGTLRKRLREAGLVDTRALYGKRPGCFETWLDFMLTPENAPHLDPDYTPEIAALVGPMSFRFLRLSLYRPRPKLAKAAQKGTKQALIRLYRSQKLHGPVLRNETLNADLAALIESDLAPHLADPDAALAELRAGIRRVNASKRDDRDSRPALPDATLARLRKREWFFYRELGYGPVMDKRKAAG